MSHEMPQTPADISCATCQACCCRLEVMLITETGVPERYIETDAWGSRVMARLDDGWCAALNRDNLLCSIYENRPLICREFALGEFECRAERQADLAPTPSQKTIMPLLQNFWEKQ